MKNFLLLLLAFSIPVYFSGCLTIESKEYSYTIGKDNSGHGTIKFINIMSIKDSLSTVESDFETLMDSYYKGDKLNEDLIGTKNLKKRLYEEDNQLCGEVSFDFDDITKLKFYKYKETGPWCYFLFSFSMSLIGASESYFSSNGVYGGDNMPVIFWDGNQKEFNFKTTSQAQGKSSESLLQIWKEKGE